MDSGRPSPDDFVMVGGDDDDEREDAPLPAPASMEEDVDEIGMILDQQLDIPTAPALLPPFYPFLTPRGGGSGLEAETLLIRTPPSIPERFNNPAFKAILTSLVASQNHPERRVAAHEGLVLRPRIVFVHCRNPDRGIMRWTHPDVVRFRRQVAAVIEQRLSTLPTIIRALRLAASFQAAKAAAFHMREMCTRIHLRVHAVLAYSKYMRPDEGTFPGGDQHQDADDPLSLWWSDADEPGDETVTKQYEVIMRLVIQSDDPRISRHETRLADATGTASVRCFERAYARLADEISGARYARAHRERAQRLAEYKEAADAAADEKRRVYQELDRGADPVGDDPTGAKVGRSVAMVATAALRALAHRFDPLLEAMADLITDIFVAYYSGEITPREDVRDLFTETHSFIRLIRGAVSTDLQGIMAVPATRAQPMHMDALRQRTPIVSTVRTMADSCSSTAASLKDDFEYLSDLLCNHYTPMAMARAQLDIHPSPITNAAAVGRLSTGARRSRTPSEDITPGLRDFISSESRRLERKGEEDMNTAYIRKVDQLMRTELSVGGPGDRLPALRRALSAYLLESVHAYASGFALLLAGIGPRFGPSRDDLIRLRDIRQQMNRLREIQAEAGPRRAAALSQLGKLRSEWARITSVEEPGSNWRYNALAVMPLHVLLDALRRAPDLRRAEVAFEHEMEQMARLQMGIQTWPRDAQHLEERFHIRHLGALRDRFWFKDLPPLPGATTEDEKENADAAPAIIGEEKAKTFTPGIEWVAIARSVNLRADTLRDKYKLDRKNPGPPQPDASWSTTSEGGGGGAFAASQQRRRMDGGGSTAAERLELSRDLRSKANELTKAREDQIAACLVIHGTLDAVRHCPLIYNDSRRRAPTEADLCAYGDRFKIERPMATVAPAMALCHEVALILRPPGWGVGHGCTVFANLDGYVISYGVCENDDLSAAPEVSDSTAGYNSHGYPALKPRKAAVSVIHHTSNTMFDISLFDRVRMPYTPEKARLWAQEHAAVDPTASAFPSIVVLATPDLHPMQFVSIDAVTGKPILPSVVIWFVSDPQRESSTFSAWAEHSRLYTEHKHLVAEMDDDAWELERRIPDIPPRVHVDDTSVSNLSGIDLFRGYRWHHLTPMIYQEDPRTRAAVDRAHDLEPDYLYLQWPSGYLHPRRYE